jgi:histidyl-tRNA synthetase
MTETVPVGPISGFPEWLPELRIAEQRLIGVIREQYELFGFAPISTPAVERMDVLLAKGGIQRQIYTLGRAAEDTDETALGLHFDLTVPLARYVAQHGDQLTFPFRRYQIQKVWRGERAQRGRFREFYQCDADIVGSGSLDPVYDAELAVLINAVFARLGVGDFVVHISNRKILQALCAAHGLDAGRTAEALRIVDKGGIGQPEATARALADNGFGAELAGAVADLLAGENLDEAAEVLTKAGAATDGITELRAVVDACTQLGMPAHRLICDLAIARGLDYYTGTVYETFVRGHERWGSVCSGGRYDDLASFFTKRTHPGVGISIGLTRLLDLLVQSGHVHAEASTPARVLVTMLDRERFFARYLDLARQLREAGVPTDVYLQPDALRDQLAYAAAKGFAYAIIAGEREFTTGTVALRNLRTRAQEQVPIESLPQRVLAG